MTSVPPWEPTSLRNLYEQVAEHIEARIAAGELQPGQRLPPQVELAREYGVAYHTARHAAEILADRGVLVIRQGGGTYVAQRN